MKTFITGVNLGGWISQYAKLDTVHFDTFIQEADIAQIASWAWITFGYRSIIRFWNRMRLRGVSGSGFQAH